MVILRTRDEIPYLSSPSLEQLDGLCHGFSTRVGGVSQEPYASLNLSYRVGDEAGSVEENRRRFFGLFSVEPRHVVAVRQVHSARVGVIQSAHLRDRAWEHWEADALVTDVPRLALSMLTADCATIVLADSRRQAIAVVHAGRQGMARGVISRAVGAMKVQFGSSPEDLVVAAGPHIRRCCYVLPEDLVEPFRPLDVPSGLVLSERGAGKWALDLSEAVRRQLEGLGVPSHGLDISHHCTSCSGHLFYSYRAEGSRTGRLLGFAMLT